MGQIFSASCKLCDYKGSVTTGRTMASAKPDYVAAICNSCQELRPLDETAQNIDCPKCGGTDVVRLGGATRLPDSHLPTRSELEALATSKEKWFSENQLRLVSEQLDEMRNYRSRWEDYAASPSQSTFMAELAKAALEHARATGGGQDVKIPTTFWECEGAETLEGWFSAQIEARKRFPPKPEEGLHLCPRCRAHGLSLKSSMRFD